MIFVPFQHAQRSAEASLRAYLPGTRKGRSLDEPGCAPHDAAARHHASMPCQWNPSGPSGWLYPMADIYCFYQWSLETQPTIMISNLWPIFKYFQPTTAVSHLDIIIQTVGGKQFKDKPPRILHRDQYHQPAVAIVDDYQQSLATNHHPLWHINHDWSPIKHYFYRLLTIIVNHLLYNLSQPFINHHCQSSLHP